MLICILYSLFYRAAYFHGRPELTRIARTSDWVCPPTRMPRPRQSVSSHNVAHERTSDTWGQQSRDPTERRIISDSQCARFRRCQLRVRGWKWRRRSPASNIHCRLVCFILCYIPIVHFCSSFRLFISYIWRIRFISLSFLLVHSVYIGP